MWNGGISQARLHSGVDEEIAQLASVVPPIPPNEFAAQELKVPEGFTVELAAAPPLGNASDDGVF